MYVYIYIIYIYIYMPQQPSLVRSGSRTSGWVPPLSSSCARHTQFKARRLVVSLNSRPRVLKKKKKKRFGSVPPFSSSCSRHTGCYAGAI